MTTDFKTAPFKVGCRRSSAAAATSWLRVPWGCHRGGGDDPSPTNAQSKSESQSLHVIAVALHVQCTWGACKAGMLQPSVRRLLVDSGDRSSGCCGPIGGRPTTRTTIQKNSQQILWHLMLDGDVQTVPMCLHPCRHAPPPSPGSRGIFADRSCERAYNRTHAPHHYGFC